MLVLLRKELIYSICDGVFIFQLWTMSGNFSSSSSLHAEQVAHLCLEIIEFLFDNNDDDLIFIDLIFLNWLILYLLLTLMRSIFPLFSLWLIYKFINCHFPYQFLFFAPVRLVHWRKYFTRKKNVSIFPCCFLDVDELIFIFLCF